MTIAGRQLVTQRMLAWTGLDLERGGRHDALERILLQRTKARGLPSVEAYAEALAGPNDPEVLQLLEVLTVGHTWFYRDEEQTTEIARVLAEASRSREQRVCAWVAGCSTGEEAYTLALLGEAAGVAIDILATDVNAGAIARARAARFSPWSIRNIPGMQRGLFHAEADGQFTLDARIRSRVRFERHNLMDAPPRPPIATDGFRIILCRNVLIYFGRDEVASTLDRLASSLGKDGTLFIGAGEVLHEAPRGCRLVQLGPRFAIRRGANPTPPALPPVVGRIPHPITAPSLASLPTAHVASPSAVDAGVRELIEKALAQIEGGHSEEAIANCLKALEKNPISSEAHLVLGVGFYMSNDPFAAEDSLRAALYLDPESWLAWFYLARAYERLGRSTEAQNAYRHVELRPKGKSLPSTFRTLEAWQDEIAEVARVRGAHGQSQSQSQSRRKTPTNH